MLTKHMRLGRDPVTSTAKNGSLMSIVTACYDVYRNKETKPQWVSIIAFDKNAERLQKYGKSGSIMKFSGEVFVDEYTKNDGSKGASLNMIDAVVAFSEVNTSKTDGAEKTSETKTAKSTAVSPVTPASKSAAVVNTLEDDLQDPESMFASMFGDEETA
jgi:single-stranded DNA-binding protein